MRRLRSFGVGLIRPCLFIAVVMVSTPVSAEVSSDDPRINQVLDAVAKINDAILKQDAAAFESLLASTFVVQNPVNRIADRDAVMKLFHNGQIDFDSYKWTVDYTGVHGNAIVVMGEEIVHSKGKTFNSGKTSHLRFTDIWTNDSGSWKLDIRQATVVSVE